MELGYAFIVTVQNNIVEEELLKLLKERLENYPVIVPIGTHNVVKALGVFPVPNTLLIGLSPQETVPVSHLLVAWRILMDVD